MKISDLPLLMACAGYPDLARETKNRLNTSRDDADLGDLAHAFGAAWIKGEGFEKDPRIDDEMIEAVQLYVDDVKKIEAETGKIAIVEGEVIAGRIDKNLRGRIDCYLFSSALNKLWVWNFKYGHGFVEAVENWQLLGEAAGALYNTVSNPETVVSMRIIQPRSFQGSGPIREWIKTAAELYPYFDQIKAQVNFINNGEVLHPCTVSSACKHCDVRHVCHALNAASLYATDAAYDNVPLDLTSDELGRLLRILQGAQKSLDARVSGLIADAQHRLSTGDRVLGHHLEQSWSRPHWIYDDATVIGMGELMGVNVSKKVPLTPAQAKKAGVDPELVDSWSKRSPGEAKVKPDDTRILGVFK